MRSAYPKYESLYNIRFCDAMCCIAVVVAAYTERLCGGALLPFCKPQEVHVIYLYKEEEMFAFKTQLKLNKNTTSSFSARVRY